MAKKQKKQVTEIDIKSMIADASAFKTTAIEGDITVTNHSITDLLKLKNELQRDENLENGTRGSVATFNLSNQSF